MDVLITDGNQRSTVAVARSLGRKGLRVIVGEHRSKSLAACSRFCAGEFLYPTPSADPEGFQQALLKHVQERQYKLLIPMTDLTCTLCSEIAEQLRRHVKLALPEGDSYMRASDKAELLKLAQNLGVPIPKTLFPQNPEQLEAVIERLRYPVVVKARRSRVRAGNSFRYGHVTYADSRTELLARFAVSHAEIDGPVVQERIEGPGCGLFALFQNGKPLVMFGHRRLRERPPSGGVSVLRESAPLDRQICDYSTKLLQSLNWTGVAMVEFKLDTADNIPKLMEINGRFWGSLQLAIDCGLDFPYWLYQISQGESPNLPADYSIGVRSRWFLGDLDHLLAIWTKRRKSLALPEGYPGRISALGSFIADCWRSSKTEMWTAEDPGPGRREMLDYMASIFRKMKG